MRVRFLRNVWRSAYPHRRYAPSSPEGRGEKTGTPPWPSSNGLRKFATGFVTMRVSSLEGKLASLLVASAIAAAVLAAAIAAWFSSAWLGALIAVALLLIPLLWIAHVTMQPVRRLLRALAGSAGSRAARATPASGAARIAVGYRDAAHADRAGADRHARSRGVRQSRLKASVQRGPQPAGARFRGIAAGLPANDAAGDRDRRGQPVRRRAGRRRGDFSSVAPRVPPAGTAASAVSGAADDARTFASGSFHLEARDPGD